MVDVNVLLPKTLYRHALAVGTIDKFLTGGNRLSIELRRRALPLSRVRCGMLRWSSRAEAASISLTTTSRLYATSTKKTAKGKANQSDPRLAPLKKAFNPLSRNYRQNLEVALHRAIPSIEAHETIERAWQLHMRHRRDGHLAELRAMHTRMQEAVEELKEVDDRLFHWATVPRDQRRIIKPEAEALRGTKGSMRKALEARIDGLFPRELRVPTDTPSVSGWDYEWKQPWQ